MTYFAIFLVISIILLLLELKERDNKIEAHKAIHSEDDGIINNYKAMAKHDANTIVSQTEEIKKLKSELDSLHTIISLNSIDYNDDK